MKFGTDCHFNIGAEHVSGGKPCQDHAIAGNHSDIAYAIVSDGCTGGGNTDIGARLITLSAAAAIREHWDVERNATDVITAQAVEVRRRLVLSGVKEAFKLERDDLFATEVYAFITPQGGYVHICGDGVVAFVSVGGSFVLHRFDWPNNTPFYPSYLDHAEDMPKFISAHGGNVTARVLSEQVWSYTPAENFAAIGTDVHSISDGMKGIDFPITAEELDDLAFIAVFSDGVTRVDKIDWKDAALDLLGFKATTGVFAKRRMINFVRDARKIGKGPLDDIAFAVVSIIHDPKEVPDGSTQCDHKGRA